MQEQSSKQVRSIDEVFCEIRKLSQSAGALHEVSAIIYRDWVHTVDVQTARLVDEPDYRWSTDRLNNNELMLVLGLLVQSQSNQTFSVVAEDEEFSLNLDTLLRELHDAILLGAIEVREHPETGLLDLTKSIGAMGREAIYYGADSFYLHQFPNFTRTRYRKDRNWLQTNTGHSIDEMVNITEFIVDQINLQMTHTGSAMKSGEDLNKGDLTNSLVVPKKMLREKFGNKAEDYISKLATPVTGANKGFDSPFSINWLSIAPIIDIGDYLYVPNQYRLMESLYESPFYWMLDDEIYQDQAAVHRGQFLESVASSTFKRVFGDSQVFENVLLLRSGKTVGEIDVLVLYGEHVIIVQAKSKRVTMKARSGDSEALEADFQAAIRDPYQQALSCIREMQNGATLMHAGSSELKIHPYPRFSPVVLLSDPFPAATFLSNEMLESVPNIAPAIWDIGILDCLSRILCEPVDFLFYLQCRTKVFHKVISDSEYNFLGYHLKAKLALPPDVDEMMIERDFASSVDDFMISADVGVEGTRPRCVVETHEIPLISELLIELRDKGPYTSPVVLDLMDFSSAALHQISEMIQSLRTEISATGKAIKAFSLPTAAGGITYAVVKSFEQNSLRAAEVIAAKHKYDTKSDRWYAIVDSVETQSPIDGLLPLVWTWREDADEADSSSKVASMFAYRQEAVEVKPPEDSNPRLRTH